jgi:hypothetical protein
METIRNELKNIFKNRFQIELKDQDFQDNISLGPKGLDLLAPYILYIIDDNLPG